MSRGRSHWSDLARVVGMAMLFAILLRASVVEAYKIPSASMEDTILIGDRLLANKLIYGARIPFLGWRVPPLRNPEPGDVIVFRSPTEVGTRVIKRCIASAGQQVMIRDKTVSVDGQPISLPKNGKIDRRFFSPEMDDYGPVTVPDGYLFVLGDNRDNSTDSRSWGFLDRELVIGRAVMVYWSYAPDSAEPFWRRIRWDRIGERIL